MIITFEKLGARVHTFFLSNNQKYIYYLDSHLSVYDIEKQITIQSIKKTADSDITISNHGEMIGGIHPIHHGRQTEVFLISIQGILTEKFRIKTNSIYGMCHPCFTDDDRYFCFFSNNKDVCFMDCNTGKIKTVYSCPPGTIVTSIDSGYSGLLVSVYSPENPTKDNKVIFLDQDGNIIRIIPFYCYSEQRCFRSIWGEKNIFFIIYELNSCRTAIQQIDNITTNMIIPDYNIILPYSIMDRVHSSKDGKYLVIGGNVFTQGKKLSHIVLYSLPDIKQLFHTDKIEFDDVYFSHFDNTLMITGSFAQIIRIM